MRDFPKKGPDASNIRLHSKGSHFADLPLGKFRVQNPLSDWQSLINASDERSAISIDLISRHCLEINDQLNHLRYPKLRINPALLLAGLARFKLVKAIAFPPTQNQ